MGDQTAGLTRDEVNVLSTKLSQFRQELGPREQTAFDYVMAQARTNIGGDVAGYDDGPADIKEPNYNWLGALVNQPLPGSNQPQPFNLSEHRKNG